MENTQLTQSKRQFPNLKCLLTKSKFQGSNCTPCICKCKEPRCGLCNYITEGPSLTLNNKTFHVKENMNCTDENVLYVLQSVLYRSDRRQIKKQKNRS